MHKETKHTPSSSDMLAALEQGLKRGAERRAARYDGIVGTPPEWLPDLQRHEFEVTRDYLLDDHMHEEIEGFRKGYTHEEIKAFLKSRTDERRPGFRWSKYYPPEITDKLDALLYIQHIVALGEEEGIKTYLGKGVEAVYQRGRKVLEGNAKGGRHSGEKRKQDARKSNEEIVKCVRTMLAVGTPRRGVAGRITTRFRRTARQINAILKDAGV